MTFHYGKLRWRPPKHFVEDFELMQDVKQWAVRTTPEARVGGEMGGCAGTLSLNGGLAFLAPSVGAAKGCARIRSWGIKI